MIDGITVSVAVSGNVLFSGAMEHGLIVEGIAEILSILNSLRLPDDDELRVSYVKAALKNLVAKYDPEDEDASYRIATRAIFCEIAMRDDEAPALFAIHVAMDRDAMMIHSFDESGEDDIDMPLTVSDWEAIVKDLPAVVH
jgi:hypothetical protein